MASFVDAEFGEITIRRVAHARYVRIKVRTDGRFEATAPLLTPTLFIKKMVTDSRAKLRNLAAHTSIMNPYVDGQQIGKEHAIAVIPTTMVTSPQVSTLRNRIIVKLPPNSTLADKSIQQSLRVAVAKILRKEAREYLPDRLSALASTYGFHYARLRFSHSGGRWGSCTSQGTISLNIALMKLPDTLIDYVLIHELCHTRHMNHSPAFWQAVETIDPLYKTHRKLLKKHTPII